MITDQASVTASVVEGTQVKYVPAGKGQTYRSPFDQLTFLITGEQTGGAFFMAELSVPPGGGTPPHTHQREEETFYLQQGTITFQAGGKTVTASAGDFMYLPRGIEHCFKNTGDVDAKCLLVVSPAGLDKFFEEVFVPVQDLSAAPPPATDAFMNKLLEASSRFGVDFLPPPSL